MNQLPPIDSDPDADSDWEATAEDAADVASIAGSESIGSLSTVESEDELEPEPPKPKPKVKAAKKPKPAAASAAAAKKVHPEKAKKKQKKITPSVVATSAAPPPVKIVKYTAANATGTAGRPLKNARAVVPCGHAPSEYPSVAAFRENPPTSPEQYLRVDVSGRKPASYRAFCVKALQPPHGTAYFVLATAADDEAALKELGVSADSKLAAAAKMQHKGNLAGLQDAIAEVDPGVLKAIGWPKSSTPGKTPAIMCPELADAWAPAPSRKRAAEDTAKPQESNVAKRFCKELEAAIGAPVTSLSFTVNTAGI